MNDITRQLQIRNPATVVDTRPVVTVTAQYHRKADLSREVLRLAQRGQVRPLDARPHWNEREGVWQQRVLQLRPLPPAWRRPLLIGLAVVAALTILLVLVHWVLVTLAALPLGLLCFFALATLMIVMRATKPNTIYIQQNVRIR